MEKVYCDICRKEVEYNVREVSRDKEVRGEEFTFTAEEAYCEECGEEVFIAEIRDRNLERLDLAYREKAGIIKVEEIERILEKYNTGKRPLSKLLGWGETTLTRYLEGDIPLESYSDKLKRVLKNHNYMKRVAEENKDEVSETAYNKIITAIGELEREKFRSEAKIDNVVKYLLRELEEITPLALQKLLYYSQAFYNTFYQDFIFDDDCQAWIHGPVYPDIYHKYKDYGYNPIEEEKIKDELLRDIKLTETEVEVLDNVIRSFGCYSGKALEEMTHSERPWQLTRKGLEPGENSDRIIEKELINKYFVEVKEKYDMLNVEDIKDYSEDLFRRACLNR